MSEEGAAAGPAAGGKVPDWLDESYNPDGTRIVEGSTATAFVSWVGGSPEYVTLDGDFILSELKEVVAMMEAAGAAEAEGAGGG
jgi:hypothetical protein